MAPESGTQLLGGAPYFLVADLEGASAHYERVLGFLREDAGGDPPEFVSSAATACR
jgi:hypothetical protein